MVDEDTVLRWCTGKNEPGFLGKTFDMNSHYVERHTKMTTSDEIDRIFFDGKFYASHFYMNDKMIEEMGEKMPLREYIKTVVNDAISGDIYDARDKKTKSFLNRLESCRNSEKIAFSLYAQEWIPGQGIFRDYKNFKLEEYNAINVKIILKRDYKIDEGFATITAYPDIEQKAIPTGRNLSNDLHSSEYYKKASNFERLCLDVMVDQKEWRPSCRGNQKEHTAYLLYRLDSTKKQVYHSVGVYEDKIIFRTTDRKFTSKNPTTDRNLLDDNEWEKFKERYPYFVENSSIERQRETILKELTLNKNINMDDSKTLEH